MSIALLPSKVAAALESTGMPFRVVECGPENADTFPYCEKYGVAAEDAPNTIVDDIKTGLNPERRPNQ